MMTDAIYQTDSVTVTRTRLVVGDRTYPIAGITSVEVKPATRLVMPLVLAVVTYAIVGGTTGAALAVVALFLALYLTRAHAVHLNTAGQDVTAYKTRDRDTALAIAEAIGRAVDLRG